MTFLYFNYQVGHPNWFAAGRNLMLYIYIHVYHIYIFVFQGTLALHELFILLAIGAPWQETAWFDYIYMFIFQVTLHLQGLFLFSLVWSIGATLSGDSRFKFDAFFRNIINGTDSDYPKPKSSKITKVRYPKSKLIVSKYELLIIFQWKSNAAS